MQRWPFACWIALTGCFTEPIGSEGNTGRTPESAPPAVAQTYCATLFGCDCFGYPYGSAAECEARETEALGTLMASAGHAGLRYDAGCMASLLDAVRANGCAIEQESVDVFDGCGGVWCAVYHGGRGLGDACIEYGFLGLFSDCAQGLACDRGVCIEPCAADPAAGEPCPEYERCADGSICDAEICVALERAGGPCIQGQCVKGAYCDHAAQVCRWERAQGEGCTQSWQCLSSDCEQSLCTRPEPDICSWLLPGQLPF